MNGRVNCPCTKYNGDSTSIFVKEHYKRESGASNNPGFYGSDLLLDGKGCPAGGKISSKPSFNLFYNTKHSTLTLYMRQY